MLESESTAIALLKGQLRGELGVVDPSPVAAAMARALVDALSWDLAEPVRVAGRGLSGRLVVGISRQDMSDVLGVSSALIRFQSEGGHEIPWLEWLLTAGSSIVIADYSFRAGFKSKKTGAPLGRTGLGVMGKSRSGGWKVPSPHAGVQSDNWVTRAMAKIPLPLEGIIERLMKKEFA